MTARNRAYLERAASSAFHDGIGQLIDGGAGFCPPGPLHSVPGAARRQARVAYVDIDPLVVSHGKAATDAIPGGHVRSRGPDPADGGDGRPGRQVGHRPARPCLAVFGLVLHFLDAGDARRVIAG
jgi:S-adenosyl methyltransferase